MDEIGHHILAVATALIGPPRPGGTRRETRFGNGLTIAIDKGTWYCHTEGAGGGVLDLVVHEGKATSRADAAEWMKRQGYDLGADQPNGHARGGNGASHRRPRAEVTGSFDYCDAAGVPRYQVQRKEVPGDIDPKTGKQKKTFTQRRADGNGGWISGAGCMDGVERLLYRLPELNEALADNAIIFIAEGERKVDALQQIGVAATCNVGGAGKWLPSYSEILRDADVVILPDNDKAGLEHAATVAAALSGMARCVRILDLPDLGAKGDVLDWIKAGGTAAQLDELVISHARLWQEEQASAGDEAETDADPDDTVAERLPLFPPMPPAAPYPVEALTPLLARAAKAIAAKVQVPAAIAGQAVLAAASLAAQAQVDVLLPFGQPRPLSLYMVTLASSGDRKTTADAEALWPVRKHEKAMREWHEHEYQAWTVSFTAWDSERKRIAADRKIDQTCRKARLQALGPEPARPLYPILTAPDPTIEGLVKAWVLAPAALGLFTAEGGMFVGGYGMSTDQKLKTAANLSDLWDASPVKRLRAADGVTLLYGRRLAMHIMVQPGAAAGLLADPLLREQGLLSRILVAAPDSIAGSRLYREPTAEDNAAIGAYGARILSILEAPLPLVEGRPNELAPRVLPLSIGAIAAWVPFHDRTEGRIGPDQDMRPVCDFAAKAAEHAARIAATLTIVDDVHAVEISAATMANAITLVEWYLDEAARLRQAAQFDPELLRAKLLLDWLQARGQPVVSFRDILRLSPAPLRTKTAADEAVKILKDHGQVSEEAGRPRRIRLMPEDGSA